MSKSYAFSAKLGFNTGFNYDRDDVSRETGFECTGPSMTQQSFADECDINSIVQRFGVAGEVPPIQPPAYAEFNEVFDFQSAMNVIRAGTESFASLDADLRARFHNDPHKFLQFVHDDANREQAELWGMVPRKPVSSSAAQAVDPPEGDVKPVDGVPVKP